MAPDLRPALSALIDDWRRRLSRAEPRRRWRAFRRSRAFLPAAIVVPALALFGVGGAYAAWDATRIDVPDVVGLPLTDALATLGDAGLLVEEADLPDSTLAADCYLVSEQSAAPGARVVATESPLRVEVAPARSSVPDVTGMTFQEAERALVAACLHPQPARLWCVPDGFSGGEEALRAEDLTTDTGFTFDSFMTRLRHESLAPDGAWIVCDQLTSPRRDADAGTAVGLVVTAPLTTVPAPVEPVVGAVLSALRATDDGCALTPGIVTTFPDDPAALHGLSQPPTTRMSGWPVASLEPEPGSAVLCDDRIRVEVVWPKTTVPNLVGLFHVPATPQSATATTAAIESVGLTPNCTGRGTVTSQTPAAGATAPVGAAVTCVAELLMPSIVGMDPGSAQATLTAAGVSGTSSGSGIVVSQSPSPGTLVTGSTSVTFHAEQPRPVYVSASGGSVYYQNCTAARAAGAAPIYRGEPGYRSALDRDNDGIACE